MKRHELAHFVDTSMTCNAASPAPSYALLGDGIESLTEEFNAETETKQWINQENGTTLIKSYTPSISVERDDCIDDATRTWIKMIINTLPIGADAQTYVVRVDLTEEGSTSGTYVAYRRKFAVSAGSTGGDAGGDVIDSVVMSGVGDAVKGTFNPTTLTFTAD